jgi:hypothetical protein
LIRSLHCAMNNKKLIWPSVCPTKTSSLELVDTTRIDQPIELEMDESKKNYLHPIAGSDAAKVGAGAVYGTNGLIRDERISR